MQPKKEAKKAEPKKKVVEEQAEIVSGQRNRKRRLEDDDAYENEMSSDGELDVKSSKQSKKSATDCSTQHSSNAKPKSNILNQKLNQHLSTVDPSVKKNPALMKMLAKITGTK